MNCARCGVEKPDEDLDYSDAGRVCASCALRLEEEAELARQGGCAPPVALAAVLSLATTCCTSRTVSTSRTELDGGPSLQTVEYGPDLPRGLFAMLALVACGAALARLAFGPGSLPMRAVGALIVCGLGLFDLGMLFWSLPSF